MKREILVILVVVGIAIGRLRPVYGQSTFGAITGVVTDPSAAIVPGVNVQVTNEATRTVRTTETNSAGVYNVPNLDVGVYRVRVSAKGFTTFERGGLHLTANQIMNVPVQLAVGSTSTIVEVKSASPVITTEANDIAGSMPQQTIESLPLVSRHTGDSGVYGYVIHNTGVAATPGNSLPVLNGARLETGTIPTMDGIAVMAYPQGAGPVQPSLQDVQEVKVEHSVAPAEFATAGNFQVVSRGGTNDFHGGAFEDYNGNALNSRNFFSQAVPFRVYNNFGANVGGPIKKNKLFFFGDYEGARESATTTLVESVPLPAWRTGDFSSLLPSKQLVDPTTGLSFAGNIIPPGRISQVSQNIQSYAYPLPNIGVAGTVVNNWRANYAGNTGFTHFDHVDARADYTVSSQDAVFGRFSWRRMPLLVPGIYPLYRAQDRHGQSGVLSWNHTLSPAAVNEFRFGATYHRNHYSATVVGSDLLKQFGITGVTTAGVKTAPRFAITGVTAWGPEFGSDNFQDNPETTLEWIDNLSWTRGRHFMKFGLDAVRDRLNGNNIGSLVYGRYNFAGVYTGLGYADFLLGIPQTVNLGVPNPNRNLRGTTWGIYAQDQFRVSTRLTLNYGVRWELMPPYTDRDGAIYVFNPASGSLVIPNNGVRRVNPLFPTNIPITTASQAGYPANSLINMKKNNIEPRVGFAYKLFGRDKTVIRGGYGIYTNLVYQPLARFQMSGGPFSGSVTYVNPSKDLVRNGAPFFSFPSPFLSSGQPSTQNVNGVNPNLTTPYTQQWNLSVEHQIGQIGLRISYVGSRSTQLITLRNLNEPRPSMMTFSDDKRPFSTYRNINYADSGGNELYGALEVSAQRKFGQNFTFNTGWTWAKGVTDTQDDNGEGTVFGGQVIQDQFNRAVEKGNDGYTLPHRVFGYALYSLPVGQGQRFLSSTHGPLQKVLGGWRTSWIVTAQSGLWFTPSFDGLDPSNTSSFGGQPDRIANGNLSSGERNINHWFNFAAFKIPGCPDSNPVCLNPANVGRFGNAGYDFLSGPPLFNLDFGLLKDFKIGERVKLTFITTMANALNHPNFSLPDSDISDLSTGRVGTIGSSTRVELGEPAFREIDFTLRLEF